MALTVTVEINDLNEKILLNDLLDIDDWVQLEPSTGHTPGHICIHISSGQSHAVMSGDLMHHPLQCAEPDWSSCFCVDPSLSAITLRNFLESYADTSTLVMPAHFPTPGAGQIISFDDTWRFNFDND